MMNLTNNDPVTETKNIPLRRLSKREIFNVNWMDEDGEVSSESDTEEESHMEVDPGISVEKVENLLEQWRKDWDGWAESCPKRHRPDPERKPESRPMERPDRRVHYAPPSPF
jgi:hypothetical protein